MKYYRLIFRKAEDGIPEWSDITENEMTKENFEKMNWEKPIIETSYNNMIHFISLEKEYLEAMIHGIYTYKRISS